MRPPIPEPSGNSVDPEAREAERAFRIEPWTYFGFCVVGPSWSVAFNALVVAPPGSSGHGGVIIVSLLGCLLLACIVAPLTYYCLPILVGPDGIKSTSAWGIPVSLEWPQVQRVRPIRILWLRYLRLDTPGQKPILWLPLFLEDAAGFDESLREFADGKNNALVQYLARH